MFMQSENEIIDAEKAEFKRKARILQTRPDLFLTGILGESTLETYHVKICDKIIEYDRLAIKACHAVGKTWIMGRLALWFINCFTNSIVITTAPTNRQVETLLWGEIRKAFRRSKTRLGGKLLNKKLTIDDDWYAMGFSPQAGAGSEGGEQEGSNFQGFHAKHVLIIFDEATGIPKDLYTMAEGLLTSGVTVKWVCIANPTNSTSEFFQICKKAEWHVMTINCFDSPNMKANGFTNKERLEVELAHLRTLSDYDRMMRIKNYAKPNGHLLSAQWAVAKIFEWGFEHPLTKSKIMGEFPTKSDDVVVKWESLQNAINREPDYSYEKRLIGVDVARFGDDLVVLTELTENEDKKATFRGKYVSAKEEISETSGRVVSLFWAGDHGKETHIGIDTTGLGAGVYSDLKEMKRLKTLPENVYLHEIIYAGTDFTKDPTEPKEKEEQDKLKQHYENNKAYMFDLLNADLRDNISMPDEEIYQEETVNIMFKFAKSGKLVIESKDDYKKRRKKSPDHSDSLAMANYCRYLKKTYGTFKGIDKEETRDKGFGHNFNSTKKPRDRKNKLKVNSY